MSALVKIVVAAIVVSVIWFLSFGCNQPAPQSGLVGGGDVGYDLIRAQSTISAGEYAQQATAQSIAMRSVAATEAAAVITVAAMSTTDALSVEQTRVSINLHVAQATATAESGAAAAVATLEAQRRIDAAEDYNLALLREDTAARMEQQRQRYQIGTWIISVVVIACALLSIAGASIFLWRLWYASLHPAVETPDGYPMLIRTGKGSVAVLDASGGGARGEQRDRPASLSAPASSPPPVPHAVTMPALRDGHLLIVSPSRSGKTTALRHAAESRDGRVIVFDPHYRPGAWPQNAEVVTDYGLIAQALSDFGLELESRRQRRQRGDVAFGRVTLVMDEVPDLADRVGDDHMAVWKTAVRQGAKYQMYVALATQSTRVRTLGIEGEGDVLVNFRYVLFLGEEAIRRSEDLAPMGNRAALLLDAGRQIPVKIPYDPAKDPDSPSFLPPPQSNMSRPLRGDRDDAIEAEFEDLSDPFVHGLFTEGGFVSPSEYAQIVSLLNAGRSRRSIEQELFNYAGGAAFEMVRAVWERHFGEE